MGAENTQETIPANPGFFGYVLRPKQTLLWDAEDSNLSLKLDTAALGDNAQKGRTTLYAITDDVKVALCSLRPNTIEQWNLTQQFSSQDRPITFVASGPNDVHLSGYLEIENGEDDEMDDEMQYLAEQEAGLLSSDDESEDDEESDRFEILEEMKHGSELDVISDEKAVAKANALSESSKVTDKECAVSVQTLDPNQTPAATKKNKKRKQKTPPPSTKDVKMSTSEQAPTAKTPTPTKQTAKDKMTATPTKQSAKGNVTPTAKSKETSESAKKNQTPIDTKKSTNTTPASEKKRKATADSLPVPKAAKSQRIIKGVRIVDNAIGKGAPAKKGKTVNILYKGKLENGKQFDAAQNRKSPFSFRLGIGNVIKGMDIGVEGMRAGGKRTITIPSNLAYGAKGAPPSIPPSSNLIFDIELL